MIAEAVPGGRDDAIVVAHSSAGLFLPLVPGRRSVRRLVFLAAVIPQMGTSLLDRGQGPCGDLRRAIVEQKAPGNLFILGWVLSNPLGIEHTRVCSYLVCAGNRTIQPAWSRCAARERLGVDAIELPGGHCPHVSQPAELAEVLANAS